MGYLVSFFIDQISIFFSSFCVIIFSIVILQTILITLMPKESPMNKAVNISLDNIQLKQNKGQIDSRTLLQENKFIKKQNQVLRKELENLSTRLDAEIGKRVDNSKKKQPSKNEDISQLQLQNAYKKYQIYKKEASIYRKKFQSLTEDNRIEDFQRRISSYAKDNLQLKEEIKQLKKMLKLQEKGLVQLGIQAYPSIVSQNQKLKEEVRILKKQIDQYRRTLQISKKVNTQVSDFDDKISQTNEEKRAPTPLKKIEKVEEKIRKKLKTQADNSKYNEDLTDLLHQKAEKDLQKMKSLANEKNKLREMVDNLKLQLAQKQKQNSSLKQKINDLRRNNQILQSQVIVRSESSLAHTKLSKQKTKEKYVDTSEQSDHTNEFRNSRVSSKVSKVSQLPKKRLWKKTPKSEVETDNQIQSKMSNYPRKEQDKSQKSTTIKWSHQHLSSKIKQLQILQHENGHIKDLHIRYEKGEPKKYDQSGTKLKYKVFSCSQDQYVQHVEGVFAEGYLQYLVVTSNHRRVQRYGNYEQYEQAAQGEHFQFQVKDGEFPGALFGESDQNGIRRLGCFIHKEN